MPPNWPELRWKRDASFILDYDATLARADELGLFVVGLTPDGAA